jgi:hypothetical protein
MAARSDVVVTTVIAAAEKALAALQATAASSREAFLRHATKQDCISCHQQYLPMAAVGHARNRSIRFDQGAARELVDVVVANKSRHGYRELIAQAIYHPDAAHGFGYELLGLAAERVPPGALTDGVVHHLVTIQASDGRWITGIPRPPIESSDVTATALAIRGLKAYGWKGRNEELAASAELIAKRLKAVTDTPVIVGVGVSNPQQAVQVCRTADGVAVGSAMVQRMVDGAGPEGVASLVREFRAALDGARD